MNASKSDRAYVAGAYAVALVVAVLVARILRAPTLWTAAISDGIATIVVLLFSVKADNTSIYDPYWSVAPPVLTAYWLFSSGAVTPAHFVVLGLIIVWSVRLTGNWFIRWEGIGDEDWRYREFRGNSGGWYWVVSFLALHLFPTVAVFLGLLPVYFATAGPMQTPALFLAGCALTLSAVTLESVADRQLRNHRHSGSTDRCRTGVWAVVRHPNYVGELAFWLGLFVLSLSFGAPALSGVGFLTMCGVFFGYSIPAMDRHLEERYASD